MNVVSPSKLMTSFSVIWLSSDPHGQRRGPSKQLLIQRIIQHRFMIMQLHGSQSKIGWQHCFSSGSSGGEFVDVPFAAFRSWQHSLAHAPVPHLQGQQCGIFLSSLLPLSLSCYSVSVLTSLLPLCFSDCDPAPSFLPDTFPISRLLT